MKTPKSLFRAFEHPWIFNAYQTLVDGGKGRQIRRFLSDLDYSSTLDIGCGTGNWASLSRGFYCGIDTSSSFIERCREKYGDDDQKTFLQLDATNLPKDRRYDIGFLVSVLHHLSDSQFREMATAVEGIVDHFFILDLYPIRKNPLSRLLYALDRGDFIRTPEEQLRLVTSCGFRLKKSGDYYCPNGLYRHTLWLFKPMNHE